MTEAQIAAIALAVLAFALVSKKAEAGVLTAPLVFTAVGLFLGSAGVDLVDLPAGQPVVDHLAEVTLALVLFTDAARIDVRRLGREHALPLRMLGLGLPLTVVVGTLAAVAIFPGLSLWEAALIGVILAPTDAALGQAVVMNPGVPQRIRQTLNVESGLNDGMVFPALLIVAGLASGTGEAGSLGDGAMLFAQNLILGPLVGLVVGGLGAMAVERMNRAGWMTPVFLRLSMLALAFLAFAASETLHGNGFLAAFFGGLSVGALAPAGREALEDFGEAEGQLLSLIVFLLFGALMLPEALAAVGWDDVGYALLSLTVLRMVPVAACLTGEKLRPATLGFLGWFGPRGLASILYLVLVQQGFTIGAAADVYVTICITVLMSIVAHGVTAAPLADAYGRHMKGAKERRGATPEHAPVSHFALRWKHRRG